MTDMEKVIKGMGRVLNDIVDGYITEPDMACNTINDAIALLKAQTPHMMTLEEAADSQTPMWFEKTGDECGWITGIDCSPIQASTIGQVEGDDWYNLPTADYGRLWRCWSAQPTEEQRKAVAWIET